MKSPFQVFLHAVTRTSSVSLSSSITTQIFAVCTWYLHAPFSHSAGSTIPPLRTFMQSTIVRLSAVISRLACCVEITLPSVIMASINCFAFGGLYAFSNGLSSTAIPFLDIISYIDNLSSLKKQIHTLQKFSSISHVHEFRARARFL